MVDIKKHICDKYHFLLNETEIVCENVDLTDETKKITEYGLNLDHNLFFRKIKQINSIQDTISDDDERVNLDGAEILTENQENNENDIELVQIQREGTKNHLYFEEYSESNWKPVTQLHRLRKDEISSFNPVIFNIGMSINDVVQQFLKGPLDLIFDMIKKCETNKKESEPIKTPSSPLRKSRINSGSTKGTGIPKVNLSDCYKIIGATIMLQLHSSLKSRKDDHWKEVVQLLKNSHDFDMNKYITWNRYE